MLLASGSPLNLKPPHRYCRYNPGTLPRGVGMDRPISRRGLLKTLAAGPGIAALLPSVAAAGPIKARALRDDGWVAGRLTGAQATVAALQQQKIGRAHV